MRCHGRLPCLVRLVSCDLRFDEISISLLLSDLRERRMEIVSPQIHSFCLCHHVQTSRQTPISISVLLVVSWNWRWGQSPMVDSQRWHLLIMSWDTNLPLFGRHWVLGSAGRCTKSLSFHCRGWCCIVATSNGEEYKKLHPVFLNVSRFCSLNQFNLNYKNISHLGTHFENRIQKKFVFVCWSHMI